MPTSRAIRTIAISKLALEELQFFSEKMKILGVYPAHPFRATVAKRSQLAAAT